MSRLDRLPSGAQPAEVRNAIRDSSPDSAQVYAVRKPSSANASATACSSRPSCPVLPGRAARPHVQLVQFAVGPGPQVLVGGGPGGGEPGHLGRPRLGHRHVHPVLRRRRAMIASSQRSAHWSSAASLVSSTSTSSGTSPASVALPARHLHPRQRGRVRGARGPDEPAGHDVSGASRARAEMSRDAPVDADVASAAYTWRAALTERSRAAGR